MKLTDQDALIVVDVQEDFCNGSLAVKGANDIIPLINRLIRRIPIRIFTRDFHPANHSSFATNPKYIDGSWPAHCVQGTPGVEYHADLIIPDDATHIKKGESADTEEYSGFDNPELLEFLNSKPAITRLIITGLATDYCVCETAIAAKEKTEYEVIVIDDACKAVDMSSFVPKFTRMQEAGVKFAATIEITNLD